MQGNGKYDWYSRDGGVYVMDPDVGGYNDDLFVPINGFLYIRGGQDFMNNYLTVQLTTGTTSIVGNFA